jgi:hypothetical protein
LPMAFLSNSFHHLVIFRYNAAHPGQLRPQILLFGLPAPVCASGAVWAGIFFP